MNAEQKLKTLEARANELIEPPQNHICIPPTDIFIEQWDGSLQPDRVAADAAKKAADEAEAKRVLSWTEFKEREKTLPLNDRANDIFRLDFSTVPEDSRGILEVYRDNQRKVNLF